MSVPRLNFVRQGQGPVVVLSHALGCDLGMWDGVAAALQDRYTVLRYDHRGHGRSEAVPGPYTMDALADDAAALIRAQAGGPVHFVGLSMGGMTAQALALRQPALLKSIVVANAACYYDDDAKAQWRARVQTVLAQGVAPIVDGALQRWFTPEFRVDVAHGGAARVAALGAALAASNAPAYAASCEAVAGIDFRTSNARVVCPALVIAGTRDEATSVAMSQAIVDSLSHAAAGARLRALDAAHLSAVEQPGAFAQLVSEFLETL